MFTIWSFTYLCFGHHKLSRGEVEAFTITIINLMIKNLLSMLGENVAIICIERSGPLPLSRCVSRVRVVISSNLEHCPMSMETTPFVQRGFPCCSVFFSSIQVRVNSPAPSAPTSHLAATSYLRRSQSAVVGSRESEERGEERARREEKRREGDPLEEVRLFRKEHIQNDL